MYFTVAFRIHISIYVSQKLTGLSHSSVVFPMHDEINQSNDDKYHQQMKLSELNNQSNDDRYYQQIKLLE